MNQDELTFRLSVLTTRLIDLKQIVYLKHDISGKSSKIFKQIFGAPSDITEGFTSPSNVPYWQQLSKEAPSATSDRALNNYLMFSNFAVMLPESFASKVSRLSQSKETLRYLGLKESYILLSLASCKH